MSVIQNQAEPASGMPLVNKLYEYLQTSIEAFKENPDFYLFARRVAVVQSGIMTLRDADHDMTRLTYDITKAEAQVAGRSTDYVEKLLLADRRARQSFANMLVTATRDLLEDAASIGLLKASETTAHILRIEYMIDLRCEKLGMNEPLGPGIYNATGHTAPPAVPNF